MIIEIVGIGVVSQHLRIHLLAIRRIIYVLLLKSYVRFSFDYLLQIQGLGGLI